MKKFRFRLEPLLTLKKLKEDEEYRNLSKILGTINQWKDEIDALRQEIYQSGRELEKQIQEGLDMKTYSNFAEISRGLSLRIRHLEEEIKSKEPELELARIRLNQANREKKILELLRDLEYKHFRKKLKREERKEIAETILAFSILDPESIARKEKEDREFSGSEIPKGFPKEAKDEIPEEIQKQTEFSEEVTPEEKPMTEMEKLQKFYDEYYKI